jgi:Cgr1 family
MSKTGSQLKVALGAAGVVLVVYVAGLGWLMSHSADSDPEWSHLVYIVNGIEALAFAAAGWLWGSQVNRGAVEAADEHVRAAQKQLDDERGTTEQERQDRVKAEKEAAVEHERYERTAGAVDAFLVAHEPAAARTAPADPDRVVTSGAGSTLPAPTAPAADSVSAGNMRQYLHQLCPDLFEDGRTGR